MTMKTYWAWKHAINNRVELLKRKGYKEQDRIDLSLAHLAAV